MDIKHRDELLYKTCLLLVQHYKNLVEHHKNNGERMGYHTRLFQHILHPEEAFCIENSIDFLLEKGASFIILASNAPSITVLNKIKNKDKVTGIYPPLKDVIKDKKKNTLIIGAKVMIESLELQDYIKQEVEDYYQQFHLENPSPLIQLIESADFLNNVTETENTIRNFIVNCENKFGKLDSITLSSTHLPWLSPYFKKIIPQAKLYYPADNLVNAIKDYTSIGEGKIHSIISESEKYPAKEFLKILDILKINLDYEII